MGILTKILEFILVLRCLFQNCSDTFPKFETLDNVLVDAFWQKNETTENEKAKKLAEFRFNALKYCMGLTFFNVISIMHLDIIL